MKSKAIAAFLLFLISSICPVWAGDYSFSGYGTGKFFGGEDKSRMCTVNFSVEGSSPSSEVVAIFQFVNTGNAPVKGDPFFSQKVQIVSKDGKTYEVSWDTETIELEDGSQYEIPGKATPEKVADVLKNHPELRKPSAFEDLIVPLEKNLERESKKKSVQLINPGGTVEKMFCSKDPLILAVIASKNVDQVIFHSSMGKFILRQK